MTEPVTMQRSFRVIDTPDDVGRLVVETSAAVRELLDGYAPRTAPSESSGLWSLTSWALVDRDGDRVFYRWWTRPRCHGRPPTCRLAGLVEVDIQGGGPFRVLEARSIRNGLLVGVAESVSLFDALSRVDACLAVYQFCRTPPEHG